MARDTFLMNLAALMVTAVPLMAVGALFAPAHPADCTVIEVTDFATRDDWQDAQSQAAQDARANGCAVIRTVRG
jgi:nitrous oxide reductase accessory protein NosL